MSTLTQERIGDLLMPYLSSEVPTGVAHHRLYLLLGQISRYLDLLMRWNERMNLTSIRNPTQIVQRHFGESLFAAQRMASTGSLLDLGSGAGFPGVPIQLWHVGLRVALAEANQKKATFLREVVRTLSLPTEVIASRAQELDGRSFDSVILRAVDDPSTAMKAALTLTSGNVWLLGSKSWRLEGLDGVRVADRFDLPGVSPTSLFRVEQGVPRGTV